ncbi:PREDICTED: uncharacterized protein LOC105556161 [Vollenhovia emeryi]|uniref:uncharacterized protein LOC105556161 n=1 Tax=Vollenhovia emeryi TaxID=411798 RepID=UPI0005F36981|nr:PREDICTED: uncharacterized protein LOC105556161 [Vollenhovia emeryi]
MKKFDIVDNTLLKLGTTTNYNKLRKKTACIALGWFLIALFLTFGSALAVKEEHDRDIATCMFFLLIRCYCFHINFISDLTTASILEYIGLKFDQVNEHLQNIMRNNEQKIEEAWQSPIMHPYEHRFSKLPLRTINSKNIMWIVIHLHLELRKISCGIDSILGTQMTLRMAWYFVWIAINLRDILYAILSYNYVKYRIMFTTANFVWFSHNVFKFLLINYMCETVSTKARETTDLLNRLSYFTCDIEIREIISQFSLRTVYTPLRFCGVGLFQFGFKFLHRVCYTYNIIIYYK